ncbi:MAG: SRPBCC family protein [Burkholderiaceae bacterium]|nr:SRPBCC family protein [Burkholderiaceae bacterium]
MEVKLEKRYPVDTSPAQAWAVLRDVRAVAGCMPGAAITEQTDDTHYKGNVKVKVGPALAAFAGDIEVLALDEATQKLQLLGKGADKSGSTASMNLAAHVEPGETAGQCVLVGDAAVIVNGKFAQFGGRMMVQVSDMILGQFADNFRIAAAAVPAPAAAAEAVVAEAAAPAAEARAAAPPEVPATPVQPAAPRPLPQAHKELNALAIVWMLIKNWFGGLFGRRPT